MQHDNNVIIKFDISHSNQAQCHGSIIASPLSIIMLFPLKSFFLFLVCCASCFLSFQALLFKFSDPVDPVGDPVDPVGDPVDPVGDPVDPVDPVDSVFDPAALLRPAERSTVHNFQPAIMRYVQAPSQYLSIAPQPSNHISPLACHTYYSSQVRMNHQDEHVHHEFKPGCRTTPSRVP